MIKGFGQKTLRGILSERLMTLFPYFLIAEWCSIFGTSFETVLTSCTWIRLQKRRLAAWELNPLCSYTECSLRRIRQVKIDLEILICSIWLVAFSGMTRVGKSRLLGEPFWQKRGENNLPWFTRNYCCLIQYSPIKLLNDSNLPLVIEFSLNSPNSEFDRHFVAQLSCEITSSFGHSRLVRIFQQLRWEVPWRRLRLSGTLRIAAQFRVRALFPWWEIPDSILHAVSYDSPFSSNFRG